MVLKKEIQIKINGKYLKGSIIENVYRTNQMVSLENISGSIGGGTAISIPILKNMISEMNELLETMESVQVSDILSKDN